MAVIRTFFSIYLGKLLVRLTGLLGGGTNLPGEMALRFCPNILKILAADYRVIAVTGTNGKTTTAAMIQQILQQGGYTAINNSSGANLKAGLVSCFLRHYKRKKEERFAVLEVDEAYLPRVSADLNPEIIAVTNIFRDQLDRFGAVETTRDLIFEAFSHAPNCKLVLNADLPMLGVSLKNEAVYYGFGCSASDSDEQSTEGKFCPSCGEALSYALSTYGNLGDYHCPSCGFARPEPDYAVERLVALRAHETEAVINGQTLTISQPGLYNLYNGLCAYACACELGISADAIAASLSTQESRFGRQELISVGDKQIRIVLVKNPAGCSEAIKTVVLEQDAVTLAVLLNDRLGDGTDVSWIYDASFESLGNMNLERVLVGGTRLYDMAIRLQTAGLDSDKFVLCESYKDVLDAVLAPSETKKVYLLATYSAMVEFRRFLFKKGYLKKMW